MPPVALRWFMLWLPHIELLNCTWNKYSNQALRLFTTFTSLESYCLHAGCSVCTKCKKDVASNKLNYLILAFVEIVTGPRLFVAEAL